MGGIEVELAGSSCQSGHELISRWTVYFYSYNSVVVLIMLIVGQIVDSVSVRESEVKRMNEEKRGRKIYIYRDINGPGH